MISAFLIYKHFFKSTLVYVLIRYGFSIGIVFFLPNISLVFQVSGILIALLYVFEMFITIPNDDFEYKIFLSYQILVLWIPGFILTVPNNKFTVEVLCILMGFSLFVSGAYRMYTIIQEDVEKNFQHR